MNKKVFCWGVGLALLLTGASDLISTPPATAHPPKTVSLAYDKTKNVLSVKISHPVPNPGKHFIKSVVVKRNGQTVGSFDYGSQPSSTDDFTYAYPLPFSPGDLVAVTVSCNLFGSKTGNLTVQP